MNQIFSFNRFSLLVVKHWADNKKRYGLSVLAFLGLLIGWFTFAMIIDDDIVMATDTQKGSFFFLLYIAGTFYASQYFSDLGSKAKAGNFLLIPASTFEKFLCGLLYNVVLFFSVFTAVFYLVDFLMVAMANGLSDTTQSNVASVFNVSLLHINNEDSVNFLLVFFTVQSVFLLGSVYFRKYTFIKTIIVGFVAWLIIFSLMYISYKKIIPGGDVPDNPIPEWVAQVFRFTLYGVAPVLWVVAYYRLKVNQV